MKKDLPAKASEGACGIRSWMDNYKVLYACAF